MTAPLPRRIPLLAASSLTLLLLCPACGSSTAGSGATTPKQQPRPGAAADLPRLAVEADAALEALTAGELDRADAEAKQVLQRNAKNPHAALVRAITSYRGVARQLFNDGSTVLFAGLRGQGFNHRYMRFALESGEQGLAGVEADLALAARHPTLTLQLCLACWERDWNHNGRVDRRDRLLFQIEQDERGHPIPKGSPRRKPTFRFDHGDIYWARAFVAFQRAALNLALAYRWTELDRLLQRRNAALSTVTIRMEDPKRVARVKALILDGLDFADQARRAYLAETDDQGEWLPNPRQKNHPMPLPVDAALYRTWELVLGDLRRLVEGQEGISVAEVAQLGDHQWKVPPRGYLDVGGMLARPRDITLDLRQAEELGREDPGDVEALLKSLFGATYRPEMKPTPLLGRLKRMKGEIKRGEESMERKLRYLLWLN